jgi:NAD(P)-dependent dehydrogenase (short-subunit alcohol dehydrogenase family)
MGRLDGKVALITGGARGQGEAEARLFVSEGARVVITDVLDAEGEVVAKDLGDSAIYLHHDVTDELAWQGTVDKAIDRFGGIDVLVNNADGDRRRRRSRGPLPRIGRQQLLHRRRVRGRRGHDRLST